MFDSDRKKGLSFRMQEGMQVVVKGSVNVYERDGKYQIYVKQITSDGLGNLYEKFEELKTELLERGMFDECYKRPVPKYIHTLGVVTAPTGAAVRDIINITRRRNLYVKIILYPAIVQGKDVAPSIINGIRALEKTGVDVMIVGRGGGSLEDLWAFNEEAVAQPSLTVKFPLFPQWATKRTPPLRILWRICVHRLPQRQRSLPYMSTTSWKNSLPAEKRNLPAA